MLYGGSGLASAEGVISLSFFAVLCAFPCCASLRLYDMKIVAFFTLFSLKSRHCEYNICIFCLSLHFSRFGYAGC